MENPIRMQKVRAMGNPSHVNGPGSMTSVHDSKTGYARGGHVSKHVPTAGHHNMDGHIGGEHHHSHKSHGHHVGVHHHKTGGVAASGHQNTHSGPSNNQFGDSEPHGGTIGKW